MALCSEVLPSKRREEYVAPTELMESRDPTPHRSWCPLTSLPSTADVSPPLSTQRSEATVAPAGQQRSPACPLHGVFLSEAYIKNEGSAFVQSSSREQRAGGEGLTDRTWSSRSDQGSRTVHETTRSAQCKSGSRAELGLRNNGSSREASSVTDTTGSSLGSTSEDEDGSGKRGRSDWSSKDKKARPLVILRNCVYSLTDFHHPGGDELLEGRYGTDITEAFEEAGHSAAAHNLLDDYLVGIVAERRQAYIQEVGGGVCLCPGAITDSKEKSFISGSAHDAGSGERRVSSSADKRQAITQLSLNDREDFHALQAAPPKLIPTGPDGFPLHPFVDFHRPLLPQIWDLSKEDYIRLINSHSLTTKVVPLMPYAWMEPFSKTHWWVIPVVWTPWALFLLYLSCMANCAAAVVAMVLLGLGVWTAVEYFLHRFVFHFPEAWLPDFSVVRVAHFLLHAVHHLLPLDPLRLVVPPVLLIFLSVWVYATLSLVLPQWLLWGSWPGGMLGYMAYDVLHYSTHHSSFLSRLVYVRKMKVYHMQHHFKHPMHGFGVSNKFWDHVFGTTIPS